MWIETHRIYSLSDINWWCDVLSNELFGDVWPPDWVWIGSIITAISSGCSEVSNFLLRYAQSIWVWWTLCLQCARYSYYSEFFSREIWQVSWLVNVCETLGSIRGRIKWNAIWSTETQWKNESEHYEGKCPDRVAETHWGSQLLRTKDNNKK